MKSMMRALTFKAAKARVPILFTNHIYDNPTSLYPELVKKQSGGSGPIYLASLLVQLATRNEKIDKNEDQEAIGVAHNVSGVTLSAMTVKNRFVPPFLKAELYNNFRSGLSRYAGLGDMAIAMGVRAPAISKIRNGHTTITADFILKVHETFDIPIKEIKAMI